MRSFDQMLGLLSNIPDPRRAEGKLYKLQHVLLFSILAVVTGIFLCPVPEILYLAGWIGIPEETPVAAPPAQTTQQQS